MILRDHLSSLTLTFMFIPGNLGSFPLVVPSHFPFLDVCNVPLPTPGGGVYPWIPPVSSQSPLLGNIHLCLPRGLPLNRFLPDQPFPPKSLMAFLLLMLTLVHL